MSYVVRSNPRNRRGRARGDDYGRDRDYRRARQPKPKIQQRENYNEAPLPQPCKVVVRNLPAHFTKEQFLQHVSPIPDYSYFAFHGPDTTLANHARCRVYIRFYNDDDVALFKEKFDGYMFVDSRGHELRCIVELAPYQRTAEQNREKSDPKCGKITESDEYKKFLEDLEKKKVHPTVSTSARVQANLAAIEKSKEDPGLTPLMEYIQNKVVDDDYRRGGRFKKERFRPERGRKGLNVPPPLAASGKREPQHPADSGAGMGRGKPSGPPAKPFFVTGPKGMELTKPVGERGDAAPQAAVSKNAPARPPPSGPPVLAPTKSDSTTLLPGRRTGPEGTDFQPSVDRGRHYFPERPKRGPEPRVRRPDTGPVPAEPNQRRDPELDRLRAEPSDPANRQENFSGRGDYYNSRGGRSYGQSPEQRPQLAQRPAQNSPSQTGPSTSKALVNPITGSREFAQPKLAVAPVKSAENNAEVVENVVVTKSADAVPVGNGGQGQAPAEVGPRVPNRARPAKELYQPKSKRRYQN